MSNKVFWSGKAKDDYRNILLYLQQNWTLNEVQKFTGKVERNISNLLSNSEIGTISKKKLIRRLVVSKQISLYYKIKQGDIYIVTLFDNRQNPGKLKV